MFFEVFLFFRKEINMDKFSNEHLRNALILWSNYGAKSESAIFKCAISDFKSNSAAYAG